MDWIVTIIVIGFLLFLGTPIRRIFGFTFNPFWAFINYKRIKETKTRASDFSNVHSFTPTETVTNQIEVKDIPKSKLNYSTSGGKTKK